MFASFGGTYGTLGVVGLLQEIENRATIARQATPPQKKRFPMIHPLVNLFEIQYVRNFFQQYFSFVSNLFVVAGR